MRTPSIFAATAIVLLATSFSFGQEPAALFDWTFSGDNAPTTIFPYSLAAFGEGDCVTEVDTSDQVTVGFEISDTATATLDTSAWVVDSSACYSYAEWGLGMGHDMSIGAKQSFTSDDLSEFQLSFDASVSGTQDLTSLMRIQFLEVDEDGEQFVRAQIESMVDPLPGKLGKLAITNETQTFTTTLDKLQFSDGFMMEDFADNLTRISGVNVEIDVEGTSGIGAFDGINIIGIDNDNQFLIDNISLVAPFDELPTLTIQNTVVNNNGGTATDANWVLSVTGDDFTAMGTSGSSDITDINVPIATYTLSADGGPNGYDQTGFSCTGAADTDLSDGLDLASGENVICAYTQDDQAPFLTLQKEVVNDNGGTAGDANWTLSATGPKSLSGVEGTAGVTNVEVDAGTYQLNQEGPDGYALTGLSCTGSSDANPSNGLAIGLGENIVCTLVDDDIAPKLTIRKNVVNDNGGTATAGDWMVAAGGPTNINGEIGSPDVTNAEVSAGEYTVGDFGGPAGYARVSLTCTGAADLDPSDGLAIGLAENIVCTITDDDISPTLTIQKSVVNDDGGTATASDWMVAAVGPTSINGEIGSEAVTNAAVDAGEYEVGDFGGPAGYERQSLTCTGAADTDPSNGLAIGLAENIVCTITDNDVSPTLTLQSIVVNNDGGTATAGDWVLLATGPTSISGSTGDSSITSSAVKVGDYSLDLNDGPDGYELAQLTCSGAMDTDLSDQMLSLLLGENVVCSFIHDDIEVVDVCDPNTMGDVDGDGTVGFGDFLVLSNNFGKEVEGHAQGDLDCDGTVTFADFLVQSTFFGQTVGGAQAVPEPNAGSLALLAVASLGLVRRRR